MAKQTINIGTAANSGNGDVLRTAFTKVNENFTELYARSVFSGSYNDLTNKPTIPTDVSQLTDTTNLLSGGAANLGYYKIQGNTIGTQGVDENSWGSHAISIDPGGESYAGIFIPELLSQDGSGSLNIYNNKTANNTINLSVYQGNYTFSPTKLTAPASIELKNSLKIEASDVNDLYDAYQGNLFTLEGAFAGANYTGLGYPASKNSYEQLQRARALNPLIPSNWIPIAKTLEDSYHSWAAATANLTADASGFYIENGDGVGWRFEESTGILFPDNTRQSTAWTGVAPIARRISAPDETTIKVTSTGNPDKIWNFSINGGLTLPQGSIITDETNTLSITPTGASTGQSLVIRPTASAWTVTSSGYIVYGSPITVTVNQLITNNYFGTVNYEITGPGVTPQTLGRPLTGSVVITRDEGQSSQPVTWTIPANSTITEFTFTLTTVDGTRSTDIVNETDPALYYNFEYNAMPTGTFITVTNNGVSSSEASHVHLVAGDPTTVDLYLGDDDQYVKIEKNGGDVVIGNNANTNHWTFGTNGDLELPNGALVRQNTSEVAAKQQTYNITVGYWDGLKQFDLIPTAEAQGITVEGWPFLAWDLSGGNPQQYLTQLNDAWIVQNTPSSPPSPLIFTPPISAALKDQMRSILIMAVGAWDALQSSISTIDIVAGNTTTTIGNGKLTTPEIIQTTPEEDLVIRTRFEVASSPPGSGPTYSERNFTFGTNGTLTFPNGTVQYGAAIDLAYLKSIVASSTSFDDFKNAIANL